MAIETYWITWIEKWKDGVESIHECCVGALSEEIAVGEFWKQKPPHCDVREMRITEITRNGQTLYGKELYMMEKELVER